MTAWMAYWRHETTERELAGGRPGLVHAGSDQFRTRGVGPGDVLFIVSFHGGVLRVVARLEVGRVVSRAEAQRALATQDVWEAADHVLAKPGTVMPYQAHAVVPDADVQRLEFVSPAGTVAGVAYNRSGNVEPQCFRTLRELTPATAALFDHVLGQGQQNP